MRYGVSIYWLASPHKLSVLNKILRRITKNIAYGTREFSDDTTKLMAAHSVFSVQQQFWSVTLTKNFFSNDFKIKNVKIRNLRKTELYKIPKVYTNYGKRTRAFYLPFYFNKLPNDAQVVSMKDARTLFRAWISENIA